MITSSGFVGECSRALMESTWARDRDAWDRSDQCAWLTSLLRDADIPTPIDRIICLGLGSPSDSETRMLEDDRSLHRSTTQHAAALTMARVLADKTKTEVPVLVQDPIYTQQAEALLTAEGMQVVRGFGGMAFTLIDDNSVVFTVAPNLCVKQIVADLARPAVLICNSVKPQVEDAKWSVECFEDGDPFLTQ